MDEATRLVRRWELNHDVIDTRGRRARSASPHVALQVSRLALEVADIFRTHGPAWRVSQRGHLSLGQLVVMSAIEQCRSAALGGMFFAASRATVDLRCPPRRQFSCCPSATYMAGFGPHAP